MKKVKSEVVQCMKQIEMSGQSLTAWFLFPESFIGFQGHFPDKKILPGVCQIQCALAALEKATNRSALLREIVLAKYFSPVSPGEEIVCTCSDVAENGDFTFKSVLSKGQAKVAELKLKVTLSGGRK